MPKVKRQKSCYEPHCPCPGLSDEYELWQSLNTLLSEVQVFTEP